MGSEKVVTHTGNGVVPGVGGKNKAGGTCVEAGILGGISDANTVVVLTGCDCGRPPAVHAKVNDIMLINKINNLISLIFSFPKKEHFQIKVYHVVYFFFIGFLPAFDISALLELICLTIRNALNLKLVLHH